MSLSHKDRLLFGFVHLPERILFLNNPPEDITFNKYDDVKYLKRCMSLIKDLSVEDFYTRNDGVHPYTKEVLLVLFDNRIKELLEDGE